MLKVRHNHDTRIIHVEFEDINVSVPEMEFAKLSILHLKTGKKMSELIRNWELTREVKAEEGR